MKRVLISAICLTLVSGVALASPLTDYSKGKTAIDITVYPGLDAQLSNNYGFSNAYDADSNIYDFGITTSLGNKFAVQYRQFEPSLSYGDSFKFATKEYNLLYQLNHNLAAFAGYQESKIKSTMAGFTFLLAKRETAQFGLTASYKIADKTNLFGTVGLGSGLRNCEMGVSYDVAKNLELNVCYRDVHLMDHPLPYSSVKLNGEFKGLGYGITYKF